MTIENQKVKVRIEFSKVVEYYGITEMDKAKFEELTEHEDNGEGISKMLSNEHFVTDRDVEIYQFEIVPEGTL